MRTYLVMGLLIASFAARAQQMERFPLPEIRETNFPKDTVNIVDFGARVGMLSTESINGAINSVSQRGGGVVLVPAGLWESGPIVLKSNVNLHLQAHALLQFSTDFDLYPLVETSWEGINQMRNQSPIWAKGQENIAITGRGVIDGNGDAWRMVKKGKLTESQWKKLLAKGGVLNDRKDAWYPSESSLRGATYKNPGEISKEKGMDFYKGIKDFLRPNLILIEQCHTVLLEGVTFQNSAAWNLHPLMSRDIIVRNVSVRNPWYSQNGDGIDIESCSNVLIEGSSFDVGDDAICIKSGRDEAGRERAMPTENVWVRNNTVYHGHGGFVVGSEMSGGARNLYVSDCTFLGTDIGLRFKTARGRGGIVEHVYIKNIYMKDIPGEAILFDMYYEAKDPVPIAGEERIPPKVEHLPIDEGTPQFRDFHIENVLCDGAQKALFVRGLPEMHIKDIYAENLHIRSDEGIDIQEASNVQLKNVHLELGNKDQLIYVLNSDRLLFDRLGSPSAIAALLHAQGERTKDITLKQVDLTGRGASRSIKADYGAKAKEIKLK